MSSNWQAPPLFFNALGMIYILTPNKGAREKACLDVLGQGYTHRDKIIVTLKENAWKTQRGEDKCLAIVLSSDSEK